MTPEQLDGIEERARKATPGPWVVDKAEHSRDSTVFYVLRTEKPQPEHPHSPRYLFWAHGALRHDMPRGLDPREVRDDADVRRDVEHVAGLSPEVAIALVERVRELEGALLRLSNEAHGFLSMADRETHGVTNMNVLRLRIDEARAALDPR